MVAKIAITPHLKPAGFEERFAKTYLGMAHLAGGGAAGASCRACRHWYRERISSGTRVQSHEEREAYCHYPIPGKRRVLVPGFAASCSLFELRGQ